MEAIDNTGGAGTPRQNRRREVDDRSGSVSRGTAEREKPPPPPDRSQALRQAEMAEATPSAAEHRGVCFAVLGARFSGERLENRRDLRSWRGVTAYMIASRWNPSLPKKSNGLARNRGGQS
ncbi:hypothetical protein Ga0100231_006290 [Opitutaceae bacterium TAV4]|nr:hypothetical protein Ga0100231_006290 [Opitutaceae bacterium TAV4]